MSEVPEELRAIHRRIWIAGLVLCLLGPLILLGLVSQGLVPPGSHAVEDIYQQVGYTFTGLVFLAAAWMAWRKGRVLATFRAQLPGNRPRFLVRETLFYTALSGSSSLWGTLYWMLVGWNAFRHVVAFLLITPALFLFFVPSLGTWVRALQEETP
jgi:hypothetical protein